MKHDETTIQFIKETRKLAKTPTLDCRGVFILGYGHKLKTKEFSKDLKINEKEATELLISDLNKIDKHLKKRLTVQLTQQQYNVLCSFLHDVGLTVLKFSGIIELINEDKFIEASLLLRRYNSYLSKKRIYQLVKLRQIESELLLS